MSVSFALAPCVVSAAALITSTPCIDLQALIYLLLVACKAQSPSRSAAGKTHNCKFSSHFILHTCHLQALMYPLLVACKSQSTSRRAAAMAVVDNVRLHSATLVQQAQLVSTACNLHRAPNWSSVPC